MICFRHADPRFPFLWESEDQPPARWHAAGEGPVQYLADTPDGAWAEFLRHEGITQEAELLNVRRALWAVELPDEPVFATPKLPVTVVTGNLDSYADCQAEARRLRALGATALRVPSAALLPSGARGWKVMGGLQLGPARDGGVLVLFGPRPEVTGWNVVDGGEVRSDILKRIRHL